MTRSSLKWIRAALVLIGLVPPMMLIKSNLAVRGLAVERGPCPAADAILVFGGDADFLRTKRAIELYRYRVAPVVVFTGWGYMGDDGRTLAAFAERAGVPKTAIRVEAEARSTRENVRLATPILRDLHARRVVIVTSKLHLLRATLTAVSAMPDVEFCSVAGIPSSEEPPAVEVAREYVKLCYYILRRFA